MTNPTSIVSQLVDALRNARNTVGSHRLREIDAALTAAEDWQRASKEAPEAVNVDGYEDALIECGDLIAGWKKKASGKRQYGVLNTVLYRCARQLAAVLENAKLPDIPTPPQAAQAGQWRDISSAPKNEKLLLCRNGVGIFIGIFVQDNEYTSRALPDYVPEGWYEWATDIRLDIPPNHWQPLPEPPKP